MKSSNQSGFAHVAVIGVVVILAVIVGVGYLVFTKKNDSKSAQNGSSTTTTTSSDSTESKKAVDEKAVKAAAKEHFALVYQKKLEEAYKTTCQDFKDLTTYSKFQSSMSNPSFQSIDLSVIEYPSVDVRNSQAKISGPVGPLSPNSTLAVSLLKKDNQWCVYGYVIE